MAIVSKTRCVRPLGVVLLGALSAHAAVVGWTISAASHVGAAGWLMQHYRAEVDPARIAGGRVSQSVEIVVTLPSSPPPVPRVEVASEPAQPPVEASSRRPAPEDTLPLLDDSTIVRTAEARPTAPRRSVEPASREQFARAAPQQSRSRRETAIQPTVAATSADAPELARSQPVHRPAAPVTAVSLPRTLGTEVDAAKPIFNPPPVYPAAALAGRIEGRVLLHLTVGLSGDVTLVRLVRSSGSALLDQAAITAVRKWRFEPATQRGEPVAWECQLPVRFTLER